MYILVGFGMEDVGIFYGHFAMIIWYILWPFAMIIWYILWPFDIFYGLLVHFWPFGIFYGFLVHFVVITLATLNTTLIAIPLFSHACPLCAESSRSLVNNL
jgi:hypothetical protein